MKEYVKTLDVKNGVKIETDSYEAYVTPKGKYRTGLLGGTFLDKRTGARDLGFGLNVTDYPCVSPRSQELEQDPNLAPTVFGTRRLYVGVEGPQLCIAPDANIEYEVIQEEKFVLIHQWFTFSKGKWVNEGKDVSQAKIYFYQEKNDSSKPGSRWDEWLLFPRGNRYFIAINKLTSGDKYFKLSLAGDWPGHIKEDNFENVYLSYHGVIPKDEFSEEFPPDKRFFYHRDFNGIPERMIRAYQIRIDEKPGPWLVGMTLDPTMMLQAWCHRREHICFIGFIGGFDVIPGDFFSNVNLIGYFDSIDEMNLTYDKYRYSSKSASITDFLRLFID